jgi:hypothetical protein
MDPKLDLNTGGCGASPEWTVLRCDATAPLTSEFIDAIIPEAPLSLGPAVPSLSAVD